MYYSNFRHLILTKEKQHGLVFCVTQKKKEKQQKLLLSVKSLQFLSRRKREAEIFQSKTQNLVAVIP